MGDHPAPPWLRHEPAVWNFWIKRSMIARNAEIEAQNVVSKKK